MTKEELTNAICPWAIFTTAIVNEIKGKELRMDLHNLVRLEQKQNYY